MRFTPKTFDVYGKNNKMEYFFGGSEANITAALSSLMKGKTLKEHWILG